MFTKASRTPGRATRRSRYRDSGRATALTDEEKALHDAIKGKAEELAALFEQVKPGRYRSLGLTALEEAVMWDGQGVHCVKWPCGWSATGGRCLRLYCAGAGPCAGPHDDTAERRARDAATKRADARAAAHVIFTIGVLAVFVAVLLLALAHEADEVTGAPQLKMILYRDGDGKMKLWACRGAGKGCKRNRYRKAVPCDDCVPAHDGNETIEQLQARIARGDA